MGLRLCAFAIAVLLALPRLAHADAVMELIGMMQASSDYKQRVAAAIGLARRGDIRAVPALIAQLEDKHHTVRGAVAGALGRLGDKRAVAALKELLGKAKSAFVRKRCSRALRAIANAKPRALPPAIHKKRPKPKGIQVVGALGTLDRWSIQEGINRQIPQATRCFNTSFQQAQYLGGTVALMVRVARSGRVRWVRVVRSDLGSHQSESCIAQGLRNATFAAPVGGEAEFTIPLRFGGGDKPRALSGRSHAARVLRANCKRLLAGAGKAPKELRVTVYIKRGRVRSAGLSSPAEAVPAAFATRFIANLQRLRIGGGGRRVGKLVYRFACGS